MKIDTNVIQFIAPYAFFTLSIDNFSEYMAYLVSLNREGNQLDLKIERALDNLHNMVGDALQRHPHDRTTRNVISMSLIRYSIKQEFK